MRITPIPVNEYRRERWKNGFGWTKEILRFPEATEQWDWRLSIAEVDKAGPFSAFPGCDRELVLLSGAGMRLRFDDGESVELLPPHGRCRFAGERALSAELIEGPTQDFNAIWRRERIEATVLHRPLVGPMVFFAEPAVRWVVYFISGQGMFKHLTGPVRLEQGDSALIEPAAGYPSRTILDGGGEVLLIKFSEFVGAA